MSIAEQITKSAQNLSNARKAILLKGGNVGDNPAFNNLASEIESIPSGDANYVLVDDTDTAYRKSILPGAASLAKLKSIGGMTYKRNKNSKNLLPSSGTVTTTETGGGYVYLYPSLVDDTTGAIELEAGEYIITLNLTANAPIYANFLAMIYINGDYANGSTEGTDARKFTLSEKTTITSLTCDYELMTDAETITVTYTPSLLKVEYELVDTVVEKVVSHGANLIPFPYDGKKGVGHTEILNGINIQINEDKSITIKGTASANAYFFLQRNAEYGESAINAIAQDFSTNGSYAISKRLYYNAVNKILSMNIEKGTTFDETIYPMANIGTTALPYSPYREPITYELPEALQGTGKGVAGYNDTVDFESGKQIKKCSTKAFDGTENWQLYASGKGIFHLTIIDKVKNFQTSICSHFNNVDYAWGGEGYVGAYSDNKNNMVYFRTAYETVDEWKAYLTEQYNNGTPVTLTYALAEPIETDLPETFSNLIEVEGGGSLEFVNEYSNAVPSHISYLRRIV